MTIHQFFEQARDGALTAIRCARCGELAIPPREFCASCQAREWQPVKLKGRGTVSSYTVIRVAPRAHAGEAPYAVALVKLKEGVSLLGRIVDIPLDKLAVGMPVSFRPLVSGEQTAIGFGPA